MAKKETAKKSIPTASRVKKAVLKTSVKTRTPVQSHAAPIEKTVAPAKTKSMKVKKSYVLFAAVIIALGALLYFGRGLFVAAVVNGQPISRLTIVKEAEKQSGRQALETIIRNTLIEQEAKKANVTIAESEVDAEVKKVEGTLSKQGQKLDDVLVMQGMTRQDLRRLIKLDKLVGKIVGKDVKVSDDEVAKYIEQNKELLPQDQSEEEIKKSAGERLKQEKLNTKVSSWLESIQTKAKIMYFIQY